MSQQHPSSGSSSFLADQPVVAEVVRGDLVESVHRGTVVALDADGSVALAVGDPDGIVYPRSASKPFQAVAMLRLGLALDGELLAAPAGSHSGEDLHVDGTRRVLAGAGLDEQALQCPPALPMEESDLVAHLRAGGAPDAVHMNCSGKHAAMLATCVVNGWPTETYRDPEHPLQVAIRSTLEEIVGEPVAATTVDGCGAPLFAYSLVGLARGFRRLVLAEPGSAEHRVVEAYRAHPEWTSGTRREETRLMRAVPGLINKAGADAVDAVALPDGRAVAVKIADGGQRARQVVSVAALRRLGIRSDGLDELVTHPVVGGSGVVGEVRALLP